MRPGKKWDSGLGHRWGVTDDEFFAEFGRMPRSEDDLAHEYGTSDF